MGSQVVSTGNGFAIAEVCSRLKNGHASVRQAALEALSCIAKKGDERAIAPARKLLKDRRATVQKAVKRALCILEDGSANHASEPTRSLPKRPKISANHEGRAFCKDGAAAG